MEYPYDYNLIYDCTNNETYYLKRNVQNSKSEYFTEPLNKTNHIWSSTFIFSLNYVLTDNIDELELISKEAFKFELEGNFISIRIVDVSNYTYTVYDPIPYFYVHDGKPLMTDEEYWGVDWSKFIE